MNGNSEARRARPTFRGLLVGLAAAAAGLGAPAAAQAQCPFTFDSLSDGSDGALDLSGQSGTVEFDPAALGIDDDGDRIFHFTNINVPAGVTLHLSAATMGARAAYWLATGTVTIDGIVDASGENGYSAPVAGRRPAIPGPGGFAGGVGNTVASPPTNGRGPGGGLTCTNFLGGGGSYGTVGSAPCTASAVYGNIFLVPFVGGSGGAGGWSTAPATAGGGGGGAGGGALFIASESSITYSGEIRANGGNPGLGGQNGHGAGGSGGALHLAAPTVSGTGKLRAVGGIVSGTYGGGAGRIRVDACTRNITLNQIDPQPSQGFPFKVFLPDAAGVPTIRIKTIAGVAVADPATGAFLVPDAAINSSVAVPFVVEARNIPANATVRIRLTSNNAADQDVAVTLANTPDPKTGTVNILVPSGPTWAFVDATWTP